MGDGLTKLSGGKLLEYLLERLTSKRIMAVLFRCRVLPQLSSPLLQLLLWLSDS